MADANKYERLDELLKQKSKLVWKCLHCSNNCKDCENAKQMEKLNKELDEEIKKLGGSNEQI